MSIDSEARHFETEKVNPYLDYPNKPILLGDISEAKENRIIHWTRSGNAVINLPNGEKEI